MFTYLVKIHMLLSLENGRLFPLYKGPVEKAPCALLFCTQGMRVYGYMSLTFYSTFSAVPIQFTKTECLPLANFFQLHIKLCILLRLEGLLFLSDRLID